MRLCFLPRQPELFRKLWTIHRIDAYDMENTELGYIKICCIHPETKRHFSVFDYLSIIEGWCLETNLVDRWISAHIYAKQAPASIQVPSLQLTRAMAPDETAMLEDLAIIAKRYEGDWRRYFRRRSNLAYVDYIQVNPKFRRQGIGTQLYKMAAQYLAQHFGLPLHSSDTQRPEAKAAWKKMFDSGDLSITQVKNRYQLDYTKEFAFTCPVMPDVPLEPLVFSSN